MSKILARSSIISLSVIMVIGAAYLNKEKIWAQKSLNRMNIDLEFHEYQVTSFTDLSLAYEDHFDEVILKVHNCEQFNTIYAQKETAEIIDSTDYNILTHDHEILNALDLSKKDIKKFGSDVEYIITYWDYENCLLFYNYVHL